MNIFNSHKTAKSQKYFHPARLKLISTQVVFENRGRYNGRDIQRIGWTCSVLWAVWRLQKHKSLRTVCGCTYNEPQNEGFNNEYLRYDLLIPAWEIKNPNNKEPIKSCKISKNL